MPGITCLTLVPPPSPPSMRILPHHQDTGGFFIAVLHKLDWLPWQHKQRHTVVHSSGPESATESGAAFAECRSAELERDLIPHAGLLQDTATRTSSAQDTVGLDRESPMHDAGSAQDTTSPPQDTMDLIQDASKEGSSNAMLDTSTSVHQIEFSDSTVPKSNTTGDEPHLSSVQEAIAVQLEESTSPSGTKKGVALEGSKVTGGHGSTEGHRDDVMKELASLVSRYVVHSYEYMCIYTLYVHACESRVCHECKIPILLWSGRRASVYVPCNLSICAISKYMFRGICQFAQFRNCTVQIRNLCNYL